MKIAIMQPYFLPYLGYFQLIKAVDTFVIYDNIKYTKKGWINRNRFLMNGQDKIFSIALKDLSDSKTVVEREISPVYERRKVIQQFSNAYGKAPFFKENFPVIEQIISYPDNNLFAYIHHAVKTLCDYLDIKTDIIISSSISINHSLKSQDKVIALCKAKNATTYINPTGGVELYNNDDFAEENLELRFLKMNPLTYKQFDNEFIPYLSILDVLMFHSKEDVKKTLDHYTLFEKDS